MVNFFNKLSGKNTTSKQRHEVKTKNKKTPWNQSKLDIRLRILEIGIQETYVSALVVLIGIEMAVV